jgi:hypothetical protein
MGTASGVLHREPVPPERDRLEALTETRYERPAFSDGLLHGRECE